MSNLKLKAVKRNILGKKTAVLRKEGITPIHVFGNGVESLALQCDNTELKKVITHGGSTRLIEIEIEKEKKPRNVFIREIQRNEISGQLLHVDFYQVDMTKKMKTEIPIIFVGDSPASKSKVNMIEHQLSHITVEALPDKMPSHIEIDISNLKEAGDIIHVKDIKFGNDISTPIDPDQIVIKVSKIKVAEVVVAKPTEEVNTTAEAATPAKEEAK